MKKTLTLSSLLSANFFHLLAWSVFARVRGIEGDVISFALFMLMRSCLFSGGCAEADAVRLLYESLRIKKQKSIFKMQQVYFLSGS